MIYLPGRLSKIVNKVLKASEEIRAQRAMRTEGAASVHEAGTTQASPAVLERIAQEGCGPKIGELAQNNGAAGEHKAKGSKGAKDAKKSAQSDEAKPLNQQEKEELLYVLQQGDESFTMEELNALLDGIASGEVDQLSFKKLRELLDKADKYEVSIIFDCIHSKDGSLPDKSARGVAVDAFDIIDDDVIDVIDEARQTVTVIYKYIGAYRATGSFKIDDLTRFGLKKEMVLTQGFRKETKAIEQENTKRFVEKRFRERQEQKEEDFADLALDQQWSRMVFKNPVFERPQNVEAPSVLD